MYGIYSGIYSIFVLFIFIVWDYLDVHKHTVILDCVAGPLYSNSWISNASFCFSSSSFSFSTLNFSVSISTLIISICSETISVYNVVHKKEHLHLFNNHVFNKVHFSFSLEYRESICDHQTARIILWRLKFLKCLILLHPPSF